MHSIVVSQGLIPRHVYFADDIKLQYSRLVSNSAKQADLDTVSDWCLRNNMIVGLNKSGIIKRSPDPTCQLLYQGQEFPVVETYKYLGMETDNRGISFGNFIQRVSNKANGLLSALADFVSWRADLKVAIYRSFVRSRLEYGAALVWSQIQCLNKSLDPHRAKEATLIILNPINVIHMKALRWIFNSSLSNSTEARNVCSSLASLAAPEDRLMDMAGIFAEHISKAPESSPMSLQFKKTGVLAPLSFLQRHIRQHPLPHEHYVATEHMEFPTTLRSFIHSKRLRCMRSDMYGKMASRVTLQSRTAGGMDYVLARLDSKDKRHAQVFFKQAIQWRRNRFSPRDCCQLCLSRFHRGSEHHHDDELSQLFAREVQWAIQDRAVYKDKNVHALDAALNRRQYSSFLAIMAFLLAEDIEQSNLRQTLPHQVLPGV